ncbi:MAG: RluA family pseudouridine synthase, partial [bacterium]|nr:RluA family pseudouridine synthase [bacterium]
VSRSRVVAAIHGGLITLDGAPTSPDKRIRGGERVKIFPEALAEPEPLNPLTPREAEIGILYEDSSVVVVDKPAGLVVHPAHGHADDTLLNALAARGIGLAVVGDGRRPGVVHRLDMDTSGVLVLAKTQAALLSLVGQFSAHTTERVYWALTYGVPEPPAGIIEAPIGRHPRDRKRFAVVQRGRPAVTHYRVLEPLPPGNPWAALVECRLETGRTHQVRVHLAHRGHPLLGDEVYGTRASRRASAGLPLAGHALHARLLAFDHPESGERLSFTSDPPSTFTNALELLRGHGETHAT